MSVKTLVTAVIAATGLAGLGACQMADEAGIDTEAELFAAYERTGETRDCVTTYNIDQIEPVTETLWLVRLRNGEVWLNEAGSGCNDADTPFTYLQYDIAGTSELCRGEIVRVIDQGGGITVGSCNAGDFERLTPAGN